MTHYTVGHKGSLYKTRQDISGMVLVIRDTRQAGVKRHHDEGKLGQGAQQAGSMPGETRLQVKLQHKQKCGLIYRTDVWRQREEKAHV